MDDKKKIKIEIPDPKPVIIITTEIPENDIFIRGSLEGKTNKPKKTSK